MTAHPERSDVHDATGEQVVKNTVTAGPGLEARDLGARDLGARDLGPRTAEVVLHEEQLLVSTRRVALERVLISKRIVTETRTIEVPVRLEQLVITRQPLTPQDPITSPAGDERAGDLVLVLHEEVPEITMRVLAVERVVVSTRDVAGEETLTVELAAETAEVTTLDVS